MARINDVHYRPVSQDEKAEWGIYEHLVQYWEGLSIRLAKSWVRNMKENPDFECFVVEPGHRTTLINYKGFALYVMWQSRNRHRVRKESLSEMLNKIRNERALLKEVAELDIKDLIA